MLRRARIAVQLASLALFLYLLARTVGIGEDRLGPPVRIFLELDPLVGLTTWLRTGALHGLMFLSLVTIALTFVLGRAFCGWVCPLGTLSQMSGRLLRKRRDDRAADAWRPSQRWKYLIAAFVIASAATGSLWAGILDPISLLIRSLSAGVAPAAEWAVRTSARALAATPLVAVTDPAYFWIRDRVMAPHPPRFEQGALLAAILLALLALSWLRRRFWCRVLCPLGGLLGVIAKGGTLALRRRDDVCNDCELCAFHCQGAADPDRRDGWRPSECFVCGNCTSSCTRSGLSFGWTRPRIVGWRPFAGRRAGEPKTAPVDAGRRRVLAALGLGIVAGPLGRLSPARAHPPGALIRPPGAGIEDEFLDRCVRCGECLKVCPGNGLHPADLEEGLLGLWTPVLRPRLGYCEYRCTLCGQVCPTGALARLTIDEKARTVIGVAYLVKDRCLPLADGKPCIVCEEHCPTSPKAIVFDETTAAGAGGAPFVLKKPRIVAERCVGCGICEYRCPLEGDAAIRISGAKRVPDGGMVA